MREDETNAKGIINGFLNELVDCGQGKWFYALEDGVRVDMSGCYMGLWTEEAKVDLIHNRNGKSKLTVLDFGEAKILSEIEEILTVSTKNGNIALGYN